MALESLGEAWVDVHARVEDFDEELERGLKKELKDADKIMKEGGEDLGKTLGESLEKEAGKHGAEIGATVTKSVESSIKDEDVDFQPNWRYNRRGRNGRFISRVVDDIEEDIGNAFTRTGGTVLNKITQGIADAIGAGFNVPGKSPLIGVLIPAVGAIIGLVIGAIQAVNGLVASIATLPALLFAVGLQVGVLFAAFNGVGEAIQGAFAAKNAKELKEAIKGLTPPAQEFVKSLLPLKGFFEQLQKTAQFSFFREITTIIPQIQKALSGTLITTFAQVASALGGLFKQVGLFFASPGFREFVSKLGPSVVEFLTIFGPNFVKFLSGLIAFSQMILPFLNKLGDLLSTQLGHLGEKLTKIAKDPATTKWLNDMYETLKSVLTLIYELTAFIAVLLAQVNAAGGQKVLDEIVTDVTMITELLASDFGQKAIEGLVHVVIIALQITTGLILLVVLLLGLLEVTAEFIKNALLPAIGTFFVMIWHWMVAAWEAVNRFVGNVGMAIENFVKAVPGWLETAWQAVNRWVGEFGLMLADWVKAIGKFFVDAVLLWIQQIKNYIKGWIDFFKSVWDAVNNGKGKLIVLIAELPGKIREGLGNIGSLLYNAGRSLIQGLLNGIYSMFSALRNAASAAMNAIGDFFPGSPAKEGPFSGSGYSLLRGQRLVQNFAEGMKMESPLLGTTSSEAVSNIVFGANSIRVGFEGVVPTTQQAQTTGSGVAAGIMGGLAARNTRLAVRTI